MKVVSETLVWSVERSEGGDSGGTKERRRIERERRKRERDRRRRNTVRLEALEVEPAGERGEEEVVEEVEWVRLGGAAFGEKKEDTKEGILVTGMGLKGLGVRFVCCWVASRSLLLPLPLLVVDAALEASESAVCIELSDWDCGCVCVGGSRKE